MYIRILLVVMVILLSITPVFAKEYYAPQAVEVHPMSGVTILQPARWVSDTWEYVADDGTTRKDFIMLSESELGSRITRHVSVTEASRPALFYLPKSVTDKLSDRQLVNFKTMTEMSNLINAKVETAEISSKNGKPYYTVVLTYLTPQRIRYQDTTTYYMLPDKVVRVSVVQSHALPATEKDILTNVLKSVSYE